MCMLTIPQFTPLAQISTKGHLIFKWLDVTDMQVKLWTNNPYSNFWPHPALHCGAGYVNFAETTTCCGVTIDNHLSWHAQVDFVKKFIPPKCVRSKKNFLFTKVSLFSKPLYQALLTKYKWGEILLNLCFIA